MGDFAQLGLDARLGHALAQMGLSAPTAVQCAVLPLALAGRDVLVRAPTGSGKTLAYLLPVLQRVLSVTEDAGVDGEGPGTGTGTGAGSGAGSGAGPVAVVLVPTKELARQVSDVLEQVGRQCGKDAVRVCNLAGSESVTAQRAALQAARAHVVVATPSRLLPHVRSGALRLDPGRFATLVLDEADLMTGMGFRGDLDALVPFLPKAFQTVLLSATLGEELGAELTALLLHAPATVDVGAGVGVGVDADAGADTAQRLQQYTIGVADEAEKFLFTYVTLKLGLLKGKLLVFCSGTDRAYRIKLFLDQFGVGAGVLNPELPLASRHGLIEEFNRGVYDIMIAADRECDGAGEGAALEAGVSRGVDFKHVDVVFNFDFPRSAAAYTHRVGRTARGAAGRGTAVSLVHVGAGAEGAVLAEVRGTHALRAFPFPMERLEAFRYRCADALRVCSSKQLIRRARAAELARQILASQRLQASFFCERPGDLQVLRNDQSLLHGGAAGGASTAVRNLAAQMHLKHVPDYLLASLGMQGRANRRMGGAVSGSPVSPVSPVNTDTTTTTTTIASTPTPTPKKAMGRKQLDRIFKTAHRTTAPSAIPAHLALPQAPVHGARAPRARARRFGSRRANNPLKSKRFSA